MIRARWLRKNLVVSCGTDREGEGVPHLSAMRVDDRSVVELLGRVDSDDGLALNELAIDLESYMVHGVPPCDGLTLDIQRSASRCDWQPCLGLRGMTALTGSPCSPNVR